MAYFEVTVEVTRKTMLTTHGKDPIEAKERIKDMVKTWDGYMNVKILEISERKSVKYSPIMEAQKGGRR